jgi:hypothetical protein
MRDDGFRGSDRSRRQLDGHEGARDRRDREKASETCGKPTLQHAASMRPRAHRHSAVSRARPDAARSRCQSEQQRMVPVGELVKSPQQGGRTTAPASSFSEMVPSAHSGFPPRSSALPAIGQNRCSTWPAAQSGAWYGVISTARPGHGGNPALAGGRPGAVLPVHLTFFPVVSCRSDNHRSGRQLRFG